VTETPNSPQSAPARLFSNVSRIGTLMMLVLILVIATGEMVHGQLLRLGEVMFADGAAHVQYFMLRADPVKPECDAHTDIEAEVAKAQAQADQGGAPRDAMDELFEPQVFNAEVKRESLKSTLKICQEQHRFFNQVQGHITPGVKAYRTLETAFFALFEFGAHNRAVILLALLGLTAAYTTAGHHHICLRPPRFRRDYQAQSVSMLALSLLMLYSTVRYFQIASAAGVPLDDERVHLSWIAMFGALSLASLWRLVRPRYDASTPIGQWGPALQSVPLIATMGLVTGFYFLSHGHPSGPAIYANKLMDMVSLPLALALHIWAGMLFKQSRLVDLFMNIMRPWKFSPETLTYIILLAAGLPTAYAGVSSVFVIAAGAIVYHEIRAVGGTSQYALASTAMSGSLGVVLSPSLLVVGIAALNRQVTSEQLFHWGLYVFGLTSTMFFLASQLHRWQRGEKAHVAPVSQAVPAMLREMKAVIPFVAVIAAILVFYTYVLDSPFNEISAPSILPVMMVLVLVFDRRILARQQKPAFRSVGAAAVAPVPRVAPADELSEVPTSIVKGQAEMPAYAAHRARTAGGAVRAATQETVEHVGAYICLMLFTQPIGGMVERSDIMNQAPEHFGNVWIAMAFLVVAKVILGMVMEPLGAILLVSSTLAPLAYRNGIDPVHFWMMVLVAFELGYLLPPVALNHLITRQVVGEAEMDKSDQEVAGLGFYRRHERWLLPLWVMSLSLVIVAFGPLAVQQFSWLHPLFAWMH
jgi:TRAP-type C4-dicarboxylate transport system permease large subunit